jgi:hypothetical protein
LLWGWVGLALVVALGVGLEALHALKVGGYLDPESETRRLLWRLGHAHAGLLALVHLGFAATVRFLGRAPRLASGSLRLGSVLLPAGFLLGGVGVEGGDPSAAILLVPLGAAALLLAAGSTARALLARSRGPGAAARERTE